VLLAVGLALALAPGSHADVIHYEYSGVISWADPSTGVAAGTPFSGTFAYDPASQGGLSIEGLTQYISGYAQTFPNSHPDGSGLTLEVGGTPIYSLAGGVQVGVENFQYAGQYGFAPSPLTSIGITNENVDDGPLTVWLGLTNPNRSLLDSVQLPATLNLADFPQATLDVVGNASAPHSGALYEGTIDTLSITVPEPAFVTLLGIVGAGWLARSRRGTRPVG
jgi:hypothetical protein